MKHSNLRVWQWIRGQTDITEIPCVRRTPQTYTTLNHAGAPRRNARVTFNSRAFDTREEAVRFMVRRALEAVSTAERRLAEARKDLRELEAKYKASRA